MRNKTRLYSILLIGLFLLVVSSTVSCLTNTDYENELQQYSNEVASLREEWTTVINDWEEAANSASRLPYLDLDAEECYDRMQTLISSWDAINPPDEAEEYHTWIRLAMDYEKNAFGVMAEYYRLGEHSSSDEFSQLRNQATDLWILKDQALFKADAAAPEGLK